MSEVAVVGPPNLIRAGFQAVDPVGMMAMAWVRSPNNLTRILPICFAANTNRCDTQRWREIGVEPDWCRQQRGSHTNRLNRVICLSTTFMPCATGLGVFYLFNCLIYLAVMDIFIYN